MSFLSKLSTGLKVAAGLCVGTASALLYKGVFDSNHHNNTYISSGFKLALAGGIGNIASNALYYASYCTSSLTPFQSRFTPRACSNLTSLALIACTVGGFTSSRNSTESSILTGLSAGLASNVMLLIGRRLFKSYKSANQHNNHLGNFLNSPLQPQTEPTQNTTRRQKPLHEWNIPETGNDKNTEEFHPCIRITVRDANGNKKSHYLTPIIMPGENNVLLAQVDKKNTKSRSGDHHKSVQRQIYTPLNRSSSKYSYYSDSENATPTPNPSQASLVRPQESYYSSSRDESSYYSASIPSSSGSYDTTISGRNSSSSASERLAARSAESYSYYSV